MERPASVTVIAGLFFLVSAYLFTIGVAEFIAPGALSLTMGTGITFGRELAEPRTAISVAAGWALIGWGLWRLRNWARWCAVVLMVLGVAGSVPAVSAAARNFDWRFFFAGAQILLRIVVGWYLAASPDLVEAFVTKRVQ
jgi:hypothetical protein